MCGLFGWYLNHGDRRIIPLAAALMIQMDERGGHSWGYYNGEKIVKGLGEFADDNNARMFRNTTFIMAHTRLASVGGISVENAHPYEVGNIIGAHNGSISNYSELNKVLKRNCQVDSMHIFHHINEGRSLSELVGYGAITYINKLEPRRVFLSRFNGGVLAAARVYSRNKQLGIVWASTEKSLSVALKASGFAFQLLNVDSDRFFQIIDGEITYVKDKDDKNVINAIASRSYSYTGYGTGWTQSDWDNYRFGVRDTSSGKYAHRGDSETGGYAGTAAEKMDQLFNSNSKLFDGLAKKNFMWVDNDGHVFNQVTECYFCSNGGGLKPTTYFGGHFQERLCLSCVRNSLVDQWYDKPGLLRTAVEQDQDLGNRISEDFGLRLIDDEDLTICLQCKVKQRVKDSNFCSTLCYLTFTKDEKDGDEGD